MAWSWLWMNKGKSSKAYMNPQENTLRRSLPLGNMAVISIWAVYITIGSENIDYLNALLIYEHRGRPKIMT